MPTLTSSRKLFVAMPYGIKSYRTLADTASILNFDSVYHELIATAASRAGYETYRSDEVDHVGYVGLNVAKTLVETRHDLVIVDVTGGNPNVFWELGVRHALAKRSTLLICADDFQPPIDTLCCVIFRYSSRDPKIQVEDLKKRIIGIEQHRKSQSTIFDMRQVGPVYFSSPGFAWIDTTYFDQRSGNSVESLESDQLQEIVSARTPRDESYIQKLWSTQIVDIERRNQGLNFSDGNRTYLPETLLQKVRREFFAFGFTLTSISTALSDQFRDWLEGGIHVKLLVCGPRFVPLVARAILRTSALAKRSYDSDDPWVEPDQDSINRKASELHTQQDANLATWRLNFSRYENFSVRVLDAPFSMTGTVIDGSIGEPYHSGIFPSEMVVRFQPWLEAISPHYAPVFQFGRESNEPSLVCKDLIRQFRFYWGIGKETGGNDKASG